jgi:hypothetical protein
MLVIRREQLELLDQVIRTAFENEMVAHSKEFSPRLCEVIGEEQLRVALRTAIDRANGYGFTNRGPVRLFIELMFLFGSGFDTDPQYPWAASILQASGDQMQRAERLFENTIEYQESVSGPEAINTHRALNDLLLLAQQQHLPFSSNNLDDGLLREMNRVFPQKTSYVGEEALRALMRSGRGEALRHRFSSVRGEALLVVLMFAFGHGCIDDPLYPWIGRTLLDPRITNPAARAERLEKKARTWLTQVLAQHPGGAQP